MKILGISAYYHDSAACLVQDGRIVAASQEERYTRLKHDHSFPESAINACLREGNLPARDLDAVVFYEKPLLKFERILDSFLFTPGIGLVPFVRGMPPWLTYRLWIEEEVRERLSYGGPVMYVGHHHAHAASAYYPSPFAEAAILTVDGVGEWATASLWRGRGGDLNCLYEQRFPHSLGLLYSAFTSYLGFEVNEGEHKVMGLASYGQPRHAGLILDRLVDLKPDGSFYLNMDYFDVLSGRAMINGRFETLFGGPARQPGSVPGSREKDIARSLQEVTETILLRMVGFASRECESANLSLGGGVALNCVANGRLLREGPFKEIWIQPAAGDAGGALGAAMAAVILLGGRLQRDADSMGGAFLGPSYGREEIRSVLDRTGIPHIVFDDDHALCEAAADLLSQGKIVAWHQGRAEFGPRSMGNRSILADPTRAGMKDRINASVKFRESFRPFAPAVALEDGQRFFTGLKESPYMLFTFAVREEAGISEVTHVDGTARVQTVDKNINPLFWSLLKAFERKTGYPVLLNTSLNVRGQPIVESPTQALQCLMQTGIDALFIGPFMVQRQELGEGSPNFSHSDRMRPETGCSVGKKGKVFGLGLSGIFAVIAVVGHLQKWGVFLPWASSGLSAVLLGLALLAPRWLSTPAIFSERAGKKLARAQAWVILGFFYLLIFLPVGLVLRAFGWDPFCLKAWGEGRSAWRRVARQATRDDLSRKY